MSSEKAPTANEVSLLLTVLENNTTPMNVDWASVATAMGYKSGSVASQRFTQIRKRLGWTQGTKVVKAATASGRVTKPRASPAKKPAVKKAAANTKARAPLKAKAKFVESDDEESGQEEVKEENGRDLMVPSDDESDQEETFEDKVARGNYDSKSDDGELSDGAVELINRGIAEKELQNKIAEEDEYGAYDQDEVFEEAQDEALEGHMAGGARKAVTALN